MAWQLSVAIPSNRSRRLWSSPKWASNLSRCSVPNFGANAAYDAYHRQDPRTAHGWHVRQDGTHCAARLPAHDAFRFGENDFSVEIWVKPSAYDGSWRSIVDGRPPGAGGSTTAWMIGLQSSKGVYVYSNGFLVVSGAASIANGNWYHVGLSRAGNRLALFLNGVERDAASLTGGSARSFTDGYFDVGCWYATGDYFAGSMSNLRVVKGTALTFDASVAALPLPAVSGTVALCFTDGPACSVAP